MKKIVAILMAMLMVLFIATSALPLPACAAPDDNHHEGSAKHTKVPQLAPQNPEFEAYWENPPETSYGYIPPPTDLSHLKQHPVKGLLRSYALPSSFDWRDSGKVTQVKDQSSCGTCWIFGTTSVLESAVLIGESEEPDFSEQSVALCVDRSWVYLYDGFMDPCGAGGWSWLASEAFIKKGSVQESCNPYNPLALYCDGSCVCDDCPPVKKVDGYRLATSDGSEIDMIKNAVHSQGPVTVAFHYDGDYLDCTDPTYGCIYDYYPCSEYANHLVSIVGWDDAVPHPNSNHGGTGAWIVKNSWGTGWGNNGFFYLAYDSSCVTEVAYLEYKDDNPDEELLYWDEAGHLGSAGYPPEYSAWMASVFTAAQSGDLTHVDFWTTSNNAQYEIYVWDGFFGTTELAHQTGSCLEYGYYSIPLSTPISIGAGQQFTVGIIMTTPGYNYPIPFEKEILGTVEPPIQSDVSFMRYSEGYTWTDLAEYGWNACLRARMVSEVPENNPPDMPTDPSPADEATGIGINPTLSVVVSDLDVDSMDVTFYDANGDSVIGTDMNVPSGSAASVTWSELNYATTYSWYAIADDGIDSTQSTIWSFTTGDAPNQPPNAPINLLPSDGATGIVLNPALRVDVIDPDGDSMDVTFYEGSDDSVIGTVTDIPSGGTATTTWSGLAYETTYSWYAIADDNIAGTTQSSTWSFTTETAPNNPPDTPSNPNPADGATGVDLSPTLSVSVNDADGDTMTVYFYDGSSVLLGTDTVSGSGTATATWTNADQYSTIYYWYTVADDRKDQTTSPTWQFTTKDKPQEIVEFSDSFEVSEWNGLWVEEDSQNDWFRSTQRATDGSRSAEVDGRATDATLTMADPIDLSGKSTATLTFSWFIEASWDSGEYIALDVHDGTWQEIKRLSGNVDEENVWHHETIDLTPYMVKNFQIRFRAKVSSSKEDGNVDNVKIVSVGGQPNNPPDTPSNPVPVNGATDIGLSPTLSVDVSDPDGDSMDVAFYDEFGVLIGTDTGVSSGTRASAEWSGLSYDTTYGWYAVADDGKDTTQSATTWHFTTESTPQEIVEFSDSFEVSEWNGLWVENSQNDWFRSTQRKNDGSYSAEVDGGATDATLTMADSIDLSGKSTATLTFSWFIESSWDAGEYISLDMFYNNAWHNGVASINGAWRTGLEENRWISVSISNMDATYLGDTMPSDFKIRFRAKVSSSIEDGNVDNVTIITSVK